MAEMKSVTTAEKKNRKKELKDAKKKRKLAFVKGKRTGPWSARLLTCLFGQQINRYRLHSLSYRYSRYLLLQLSFPGSSLLMDNQRAHTHTQSPDCLSAVLLSMKGASHQRRRSLRGNRAHVG